MNFLYAVIMGIIQGLTEFLPVSSSGHLAIFEIVFGVESPGLLFDVLLHIGTLIAVFLCFYKDIFQMIKELFLMIADLFRGKKKIVNNTYRKMDLLVIVATIPTGIIAAGFDHVISGEEKNTPEAAKGKPEIALDRMSEGELLSLQAKVAERLKEYGHTTTLTVRGKESPAETDKDP